MSDSCDPLDCSLPGSFVHGILQARILGWVAFSFFRGSFWPRDRAQVSCMAGIFFTNWAIYYSIYRYILHIYMCVSVYIYSIVSNSFIYQYIIYIYIYLYRITYIYYIIKDIWLSFSCSIMSNPLQPHGLQHNRLTCTPSLSPRVCSNSCSLSWWVTQPFHPLHLIFPASGFYSMSQLSAFRWPKNGASASASDFPF